MGIGIRFSAAILFVLFLALIPLFQNCSGVSIPDKVATADQSLTAPPGEIDVARFQGWAGKEQADRICDPQEAACSHWKSASSLPGLEYQCRVASDTHARSDQWTVTSSKTGSLPANYPDAAGRCLQICDNAFQSQEADSLLKDGLVCQLRIFGSLSDFPFEHRNTFFSVGTSSTHADVATLPWDEKWSWRDTRQVTWARAGAITTETLASIRKAQFHLGFPDSHWLSTEELFDEQFRQQLDPMTSVSRGALSSYDPASGSGTGWACVQGSTQKLRIRVWAGSENDEHVLLAETETDQLSDDVVLGDCGTVPGSSHGFKFQLSPAVLASLTSGRGFCHNRLEVSASYLDSSGVEKIFTVQDRFSGPDDLELPSRCATF